MELSAIWVVVIVLIGIAIGVYSICKGCQGLREQSAQALANLQERNAPRNSANGQPASDGAGSDSNMYHISGSSVLDKNPPNYDEIMEPPPSYEETIKLHGATCLPTSASAADVTSCAQVNYAYTHSEGDELSNCSRPATTSNDSSTSTPTTETTIQMDQSSSTTHTTADASSSTSSCTVAIES